MRVRAFPVRLPSGVRYWAVIDEDLAVVGEVDAFLRYVRFGHDGSELTTRAVSGVDAVTGGAREVLVAPGTAPVRGVRRINAVLTAVRVFITHAVTTGHAPQALLPLISIRFRAAWDHDPGLDEGRWDRVELPIARGGEVILRGLSPLLIVQVLVGVQQRCRVDAVKTEEPGGDVPATSSMKKSAGRGDHEIVPDRPHPCCCWCYRPHFSQTSPPHGPSTKICPSHS